MLSTANSPSPDCDELISSSINSDERASGSSQAQLSDLTPNFSIRNYVFAARSKDICANWPFSQRTLELCRKHGVKDLLPPFQSLDDVRKRSFPRIPVETISSLKQDTSQNNRCAKPSRLNNDDSTIIRSDDGLANDKVPTISSQLLSESLPNSVSARPDTLLRASVEKEVAGPIVSHMKGTAVRSAGRKGRMVVKLGGNLGRSSTEEMASICTAVSETMASKVCPVCKTFSSSSNTTLNAHIDQCLSEEPSPKWPAGSRLIRHKIKPRKTRLMVDIYETARHCTLEDLDRRNGSNWATERRLPSKETSKEAVAERVLPPNSNADVGAVYIDSSGTKLRILSKSSDGQPASSMIDEASMLRRSLKEKISKFLLSKKKKKRKKRKQNTEKPHKSLQRVSESKVFRSHEAQLHGSQDQGGKEDVVDTHLRVSRSLVPLQSSDNGTLKPWSCSKRSGTAKQVMGKDQRSPRKSNLQLARDNPIERRRKNFATILSSDGDSSDSSEDTRSCDELRVPAFLVDRPGKRKLRRPSFYGRPDNNVKETHFQQMKQRVSSSSEVFGFTRGCVFHGSISRSFLPAARRKSSYFSGMSQTKDVGFNRRERKEPSAGFLRTKFVDEKRVSARERSEVHMTGTMGGYNLEDDSPRSTEETAYTTSLNRSFTGSFGLDTRQDSVLRERRHHSSDEGKHTESSISLSHQQMEKLDDVDSVESRGRDNCDDDVAAYPRMVADGNDLNLGEYLNQGSPVEKGRIPARSSTDIYKVGLCDVNGPTFPNIVQEDIGDVTNRVVSDVNMEINTQLGHEYEVERILIPGPPGSFLPSPGALGSEEFQGNSSLTTSRVQSSLEQQDLVDGNSSDSPVSVMSTVSNSAPAGSESKCGGQPVPAGISPAHEEKSLSGFSSDGGNVESPVFNAASPRTFTAGASSERKSVEKGPYISKNNDDDQPCRCQQKERAPNFQESQLLRRRNLSGSLAAIGLGMPAYRNIDVVPIHGEGHLEMLPQIARKEMESKMMSSSSVPVTKFSTGEAAKGYDRGQPDPVTPSVSNPVLRLMGKNLMVVNKEEYGSTPLGHPQSASTLGNNPSSSQVSRMAGVTYGVSLVSSSGVGPIFGSQLPAVMEPPRAVAPTDMSRNRNPPRYYDGTYYFSHQPPGNNEVIPNARDPRPMKEIIIIDDGSEDEMNTTTANIRRNGFSRERQAAAQPVASFPMRTTVCYDPRLVSTVPVNYPAQDPSLYGQVPVPRRAGSSTPANVQWWPPPAGPGPFQFQRGSSCTSAIPER